MQTWRLALVKQRPDLTMDMIDKFQTRMYVTNADFVFRVPRDVVQRCQAPVLVLPDETPAHPYEPAIESVRHVRTFLKANRPA